MTCLCLFSRSTYLSMFCLFDYLPSLYHIYQKTQDTYNLTFFIKKKSRHCEATAKNYYPKHYKLEITDDHLLSKQFLG